MDRLFTRLAGRISTWAGQPYTFALAIGVILVWAISGPVFRYSDTWQLIINTGTTIVTFLMVFLIQNSQNRDAGAMQAKLDEMLRALEKARGAFIGIEHLSDGEIQKIREALERETGNGDESEKGATTGETVDQLIRRS
jgi:low affinity Fe/Cu permease